MSATRADSLTAVALAGVAHNPGATPATGAPVVDQLPLPGDDAGRDLLLRAGAAAVYRAAGRLAQSDVAAPEPAPDETRPPCPPDAAALIESLLMTRNHALLQEAFARMARCGYVLPPALLPLALDTVQRESRPALIPLISERGRWLARFNPTWAWAAETLPDGDAALPPDAETVWQEGATAQRVALLAQARASDPARAREWLAGVWKQEKAETRAAMLETFATGLAPDDEPLLESALNDRSERVRTVAAGHLALLPNSALAGRIRARADAALVFNGSALDANPPTATGADWTRDGLPQPRPHVAFRAFWLRELLERVPPSYWERRFARSPAELVAATDDAEWRPTILAGWIGAAARYRDAAWAVPLWEACLTMPIKQLQGAGQDRASLCAPLAPLMPPERLESFALRAIAVPRVKDDITVYDALEILPRPWSLTVARAYLDGLRAFIGEEDPAMRDRLWTATLDYAALALPEAAFPQALEPPLAPPISAHTYAAGLATDIQRLEAFAETIRLRERLVKVLPL